MEKKNIAILINSLAAGGAERVVSVLSESLSERYNLYVMLLDTSKVQYDCVGKICNVGGNGKNYYSKVVHTAVCINKIIKKEQIKCVISLLDVPNIINSLIIKGCKRVISIHGYFNKNHYKTPVSKIKLMMCRHIFKKADGVVCVSQALGRCSIPFFKLDERRVKSIENPFNLEEIVRKSHDRIECEIEEFINSHQTSVAVGRINHMKGYLLLIQAFASLCRQKPDAGLIILGDGPEKEKVQNLIYELKIGDNVMLLGIKSNPFVYMAKTKIYVSASLAEGFPNTLVEAMACGLPVIQTDCLTGPREILTQNYEEKCISEPEYADFGILMPDFGRADLIDKTKDELIQIYAKIWMKLLDDTDMQQKYGELARQRAKKYSVEECAKKYCELIDNVVE